MFDKLFPFFLVAVLAVLALAPAGCAGNGGSGGDDDTADDDAAVDDDTVDDDADDDTTPGDFVATLVTNPICEISCVVSWTTDQPASSWVEFGVVGQGYSYQIGSDDLTTAHQVIVIGMHADQWYQLQAVSRTGKSAELRSQEMTFQAGSLPVEWLSTHVDVYNATKAQDGWTITNLNTGTMDGPLAAAIFDMNGEPVWYYIPSGETARVDMEVHLVENEKYVVIGPAVAKYKHPFKMDLQGNIVWEGPVQLGGGFSENGTMHHVFHELDNGDYVLTKIDQHGTTQGDWVQEIDPALNILWSWDTWQHLPAPGPVPAGDWTHVNTVFFDFDNGFAYINCWGISTFFKIAMDTGNVIWAFGDGGDFAPDPNAEYPWVGGGHGVDSLGNGNFLFYDNGGIMRGFSRAIIYHLNEDTMQSTIVWEYQGQDETDQWFNLSLGDADQLENGNILITAGNGVQQSPSRFIEVTPAGEKVWQCWLYTQPETAISSFQADRIPALATPL